MLVDGRGRDELSKDSVLEDPPLLLHEIYRVNTLVRAKSVIGMTLWYHCLEKIKINIQL
jgi:hypothetical protein